MIGGRELQHTAAQHFRDGIRPPGKGKHEQREWQPCAETKDSDGETPQADHQENRSTGPRNTSNRAGACRADERTNGGRSKEQPDCLRAAPENRQAQGGKKSARHSKDHGVNISEKYALYHRTASQIMDTFAERGPA